MATSSARHTDLYDYTRTAEQIDHDLIGQADRLISRLSYFEATCREPGFALSTDSLGSALRSYGVRALPVDQNVRKVGEAFQRADGSPIGIGMHHGFGSQIDWRRLLPFAISPTIVIGALLPHVDQWLRDSLAQAWNTLEATSSFALRIFPDTASDSYDLADFLISFFAVKTLSTSISSIPGRYGLSAPQWARTFLDLKATHLKGTTLISKLTKPNFGKLMLLGAIIKSFEQAQYDFDTFSHDNFQKWTAVVFDSALILSATAGTIFVGAKTVAVAVALLGLAGVSLPAVAVGAAVVGVTFALGWAVNKFLLDPYLKSDWHTEHVEILADNLQEFQRDPLAFTKVLGSEFTSRLGSNAQEFKRDPKAFMGVLGSEFVRAVDKGTGLVTNVEKSVTQLKSHADGLVNFIMGDPEPPEACIAI